MTRPARTKLHAVATISGEVIRDMHARDMAERDDPERWRRVMIEGDRAKALPWFQSVRRTWRG